MENRGTLDFINRNKSLDYSEENIRNALKWYYSKDFQFQKFMKDDFDYYYLDSEKRLNKIDYQFPLIKRDILVGGGRTKKNLLLSSLLDLKRQIYYMEFTKYITNCYLFFNLYDY